MKRNIFLIMLVMILALGITVIGCDNGSDDNNNNNNGNGNGNGNGTDMWSNVTNISQLNGSWKAPSTVTGNMQGITVNQSYSNYIITFNATAKTMTTSGSGTTTFSGGNIDTRWSDFKSTLQSQYNGLSGVTVSFNNANHSYTMTCNNFSITVPEDFTGSPYQINQNSTKLKVSNTGMGTEIIYTKQ